MADDKLAVCMWFVTEAEEAANFYCSLFPQSEISSVHRSPSAWPGGRAGDVITVGFTLLGVPAMAMNGGPGDRPNNAISLQVFTDTQDETDRYWAALTEGGGEMACSWCYDRYGVRWQVVPRVLMNGLEHKDADVRARVFSAMQAMVKIDHAQIKQAIAAT